MIKPPCHISRDIMDSGMGIRRSCYGYWAICAPLARNFIVSAAKLIGKKTTCSSSTRINRYSNPEKNTETSVKEHRKITISKNRGDTRNKWTRKSYLLCSTWYSFKLSFSISGPDWWYLLHDQTFKCREKTKYDKKILSHLVNCFEAFFSDFEENMEIWCHSQNFQNKNCTELNWMQTHTWYEEVQRRWVLCPE